MFVIAKCTRISRSRLSRTVE